MFKLNFDKGEVIWKTLLSIALFVVSFIIIYKNEGDIGFSIFFSLMIGGFLWGWSLTKRFFPDFHFFERKSNNSSTSEHVANFAGAMHIMGVSFRITIAAMVGMVALPVGIIITIIVLIGFGKKISDAVKADNEANNQEEEKLESEKIEADKTEEKDKQETSETNNE